MSSVCLQCVILLFPDPIHLLFFNDFIVWIVCVLGISLKAVTDNCLRSDQNIKQHLKGMCPTRTHVANIKILSLFKGMQERLTSMSINLSYNKEK